jgi:hypothetical protein
MSDHEQYRELSALAAIGLLSSEEDLELSAHLRECEICREIHDSYSRLIQHQLPQADAIRWRIKSANPKLTADTEFRDRFMARAQAEGLNFSSDALRNTRALNNSYSTARLNCLLRPAFGLGVIVIAIFVGARPIYQESPRSVNALTTVTKSVVAETEDPRLSILRKTVDLQAAQLVQFRKENLIAEDSVRELQTKLEEARSEVATLTTELGSSDSRNSALAGADKQQDTIITDLKAQIDRLDRQRADNLSELVVQEQRIRELTKSSEEAVANLDREQQLMAASDDVRRLMGARNLHIIDVQDVNGSNRSAKAFGRVFYAEGQVLIFYAFDLRDGAFSPAKYTFQAWGQRDSESRILRNLGTFQVDDHEQRRWVLKVDNPGLLAGIDSVFVTAESLSDAKEPRGKKLLYAYIVGQPNHP